MSSITVNGADVLSLHMVMEPVGAWDLVLEADAEALSGAVVLDDGEGNVFRGYTRRAASSGGRLGATIVGGKGGLSKPLASRHFREVPLRIVLADILAQSGEQLASSAQPETLGRHLPFWSMLADSAGAALRILMREAAATWRVLDSGAVWVGVDSFAKAPVFEYEELERDDAAGLVVLGVDGFWLRPGMTLDGRKVGRVEHTMSGAELRTTYWHG